MKKRLLSVLLVISMMATMLVGCGDYSDENSGTETTTSTDSDESILRISQSLSGDIDPAIITDYAGAMTVVNLYDSLVYPDMDNEIVGGLASDWEISDDGLEYTFYLNEGTLFHDGTELLASDVEFSAERFFTMGEGFSYLFTDYVDSVVAVDDYTVKITLTNTFAPFLSILCRLYVVNEDLVMENLADGSYGEYGDYGKAYLAEHDAGSGAYYLDSYTVLDTVTMKMFEDYYGEFAENAPETVQIINSTETATVRTLMTNGELEISDQWQTTEAYEALDSIDGVTVSTFQNGQMLYMMLNTALAPTDDEHIRKALAYLIDYAQVCETIFPGYVDATSMVPDGIIGHTDEYDYYYYSLEMAAEELALSAYADSLDEISVEISWMSAVPDEEKLALLVQAAAAEIGLTVEVTKDAWSAHVDSVAQVDTTPNATIMFVSPDYAEAGSLLSQRFDSDTAGTWQQTEWLLNDDLDAMLESALTEMDYDTRMDIYADIQEWAMDECWGIAVAEQAIYHAYSEDITFPAMERAAAGESVCLTMGYCYLFSTFSVN